MANPAAIVANIQALMAMETMASGILENFHHTIEMEVLNGETDGHGELIYNGMKEIISCTEMIRTSDHDHWVVDTSTNPITDMSPPSQKVKIPEKEGFLVGLRGAVQRGAYMVYPFQTAPIYFGMSEKFRKGTVWDGLTGPDPARLPTPGRFYPTFFITVYNSHSGAHYTVTPSYYLSPIKYDLNNAAVISSMSKNLFKALYGDDELPAMKNEQHSSVVIDFTKQGGGMMGAFPIPPRELVAGFHGVKDEVTPHSGDYREYYLDEDGNRAMPFVQFKASKPKNDDNVLNVQVTLHRDYTQPKIKRTAETHRVIAA